MGITKKGATLNILLFIFLITISTLSVCALPDQVIINSRDWKEIYSGMNYASLVGVDGSYIIEESRATLFLDAIDKTKPNITLIESKDNPYVKGYKNTLEGKGFQVSQLEVEDNLNIQLAENSEVQLKKFIIIDEAYSYNSVSVAPYAALKGYYVLFANQGNIDEIVALLENKDPTDVLLYGYLDRTVREQLSSFPISEINEGSKYANNREIVRKFVDNNQIEQVVLTNGEFIEPQFFSPISPVIFIGTTNTPEKTFDFVKNLGVSHGILIGNDLVDLAVSIKGKLDLKIMVKFAKGINQVQYTLDIVELPKPNYNPIITDISYNLVTEELIVTTENLGTTPVISRASYAVMLGDETIATLGDEGGVFIPANSISTRTYKASLTDYKNELIKVKVNMLYGEDLESLDFLKIEEREISFIELTDNSKLDISDFYYDPSIKRFIIEVTNSGDETVYFNAYLEDFLMNERSQQLSTDQIYKLSPGESTKAKIKAKLSKEDIEENGEVHIKLWYGSQKNFLFRLKELDTQLVVLDYMAYYIGAGVVLLLSIMIYLIIALRKGNKKRPVRHTPHHYRGHQNTHVKHNNHRHVPPPRR